jgi:hypothetical protein
MGIICRYTFKCKQRRVHMVTIKVYENPLWVSVTKVNHTDVHLNNKSELNIRLINSEVAHLISSQRHV